MLPFKNNEAIQRFQHQPIMVDEVLNALQPKPEGIYLDGTMGGAGHSRAILEAANPSGKLIALDRDEIAIEVGQDRLAIYGERACVLRRNFSEIQEIAAEYAPQGLDGILLDIGVSSPQLDDPERGFSYQTDAPLDMRMDREDALTAWTVVNQWPQGELRRILTQYGEERHAGAIASAIVRAREQAPIATTGQLVEVIRRAMPAAALREKQHPAKRSFQAIRIAVNDELGSVSRMLQQAIPRLRPGGRLAVISFHSLEDRIVKSELAAAAKGCVCPPSFPVCVCGRQPQVRLVSRKPILPSQREIDENPRARSAKLRLAEKLDQPQGNQPDEVE